MSGGETTARGRPRLSEADASAAAGLVAVRPAWTGMPLAADALGLEAFTLLHAGPPADPPHDLVAPTLNSAAVACVFEGWAETLDDGLALARSGRIRFEAAQDRGVATPMAAVVSPSMRLIEMRDAGGSAARGWAPINGGGTGAGPCARYGRRTGAELERQRLLNGAVAERLESACRAEPLEWLPLADQALLDGDDLHLRHVSANEQLLEALARRLGSGFRDSPAGAFIAEWPFFHLNFAMAAARAALTGAAGVPGSGLVTALGGNGAEAGLQVSAFPGRWFTAPAGPPRGNLRAPYTVDDCVGAYGDSALLEAVGLGAFAHRFAPEMQAFHAGFAPDDLLKLPDLLLARAHPGLARSGARTGLSVRTIVETGTTPVIELGIVERSGEAGGLGAGIYRPPLAPFAAACAALAPD